MSDLERFVRVRERNAGELDWVLVRPSDVFAALWGENWRECEVEVPCWACEGSGAEREGKSACLACEGEGDNPVRLGDVIDAASSPPESRSDSVE